MFFVSGEKWTEKTKQEASKELFEQREKRKEETDLNDTQKFVIDYMSKVDDQYFPGS